MSIGGLHHVTAIASDAQANFDFYAGLLGLRLVKRTVNFDDPFSYHLYYGTELGAPGTILTFFAWPGAFRGRSGAGQVNATALSIPPGSLDFWRERLRSHGIAADEPMSRFDELALGFEDRDGMRIELIVAAKTDERPAWAAGPVPAEFAIRGLHSVTAWEEGYERTARMLTDVLGFRQTASAGNRFRYESENAGVGSLVDLLCTPDAAVARGGAGAVHHIAWRTADDAEQLAQHRKIAAAGLNVSPVLDRTYFKSIYFREPGGVLFEIATDPPGFTLDEPSDQLGRALRLPPWLEPMRAQIAAKLPPLVVP